MNRWVRAAGHAGRLVVALAGAGCTVEIVVGDSRLGDAGTDAGTCEPLLATSVAVSHQHACAVGIDGRAFCWGLGESGQLGRSDTSRTNLPLPVLTNDRFDRIDTGSVSTCARRLDGALLCFGNNFTGLLGDGTSQSSPTPAVALADVSSFAHYDGTILARVGDDVYGWGDNGTGLLGLGAARVGEILRMATPIGVTARYVEAGPNHACLIDLSGHVRCAGDNVLRQLGIAGGSSPTFVPVDDALTFTQLDLGLDRTCGILDTGALVCWGNNDPVLNPDIGNPASLPWPVGVDRTWTAVSVGFEHVCGLRDGGRLFCWGADSHGELGAPGASPIPREVLPGTTFSAVDAGRTVTCALRASDGAVVCFGLGADGQLGRGVYADGPPGVVCAPR